MINGPYSADIIKAHDDRIIFIEDYNENNKGHSTAYGLEQLFSPRKNTLKKAFKNLLDILQKSGAEWSRSVTINSFDSKVAALIKEENLKETQTRRLLGILIGQINNLVSHSVSLSLDVFSSSMDLQSEMDKINCHLSKILESSFQNEFYKVVPTLNISECTKWDSPIISRYIELSYKYGVPHFTNYLTGTISPSHMHNLPDENPASDVIYLTHGGVMGNADGRGLVGSVTINLPRVGYLSKDEDEFMERIDFLSNTAKVALEQKRKNLKDRLY